MECGTLQDISQDRNLNETVIHRTNTSLPVSSVGFPFDDIRDSRDVSSSTSEIGAAVDSFGGRFLNNLFIKCLSARGSCSQNRASVDSPNIAAAKANLAAQPLSTILA